MTTVVDENNPVIDAESEVKKLQDLVKKLERQNQILRNKHNQKIDAENHNQTGNVITPTKVGENSDSFTKHSRTKYENDNENLKDSLKNFSLEDVEPLDLDSVMSEDDEESWLYTSPKRPTPEQKSISPYKWVRQEFENPIPEVEHCKRSLLTKLDEVSRAVSRSSSLGTLASLTSPTGPSMLLPGEVPQPTPAPSSCSSGMPPIRQPIVSGLGGKVDSSTFTRPKKTKPKPEPIVNQQEHIDFYVGSDKDSSNERLNSDSDFRSSRDELKSSDDEGVHKISDVVDVRVLARLQEESLRQSYNSPIASPRKCLSKSYNTSGIRSLQQDADSPSSQSSTRSSPGRYDGEPYQATRRSNNSLTSASSHSNTSSPPDSPYGSQYLETKQHTHESHRRSLPNLNTGRLSLPQNHSEPRLARDSPPRSRLAAPRATSNNYGARNASPGRSLSPASGTVSPGRTLSPARSSLPSPKSRGGIPRPASASKLRPPRKSSIPSPRRSLVPKTTNDESWKDGCF